MNKLEEILGTKRRDNESWEDVFSRISRQKGVGDKLLQKVLIYVLGELDAKEENKINQLEERIAELESNIRAFETDLTEITERIGLGSKTEDVSGGDGGAEEGVQDTDGNTESRGA